MKKGSICLANASKSKDDIRVLFDSSWERSGSIKSSDAASHSEIAAVQIEQALEKNGLKPNELEFLCCSIGPGSFTGIRVAVNYMRALAWTLNIPVIGINTLEVLAQNALEYGQKTISCLTNAQKNLGFFSQYEKTDNNLIEIQAPILVNPQKVSKLLTQPTLCLGDGWNLFESRLDKNVRENIITDDSISPDPKASLLLKLALHRYRNGEKGEWNSLLPLYLKASEAEENLRKGILKPVK